METTTTTTPQLPPVYVSEADEAREDWPLDPFTGLPVDPDFEPSDEDLLRLANPGAFQHGPVR